MKRPLILLLIFILPFRINAQILPGFKPSGSFNEQQMLIENSPQNTRILINAPIEGFGKSGKVMLILFALPNGNTIEQTFGKVLREGDDWHFNIQHIGAQTRFLRGKLKNVTVVTAYLEAKQKSWSSWVANTPDSISKVRKIVDDLRDIFKAWDPIVVLNSHSGGGRFIFSFIDANDEIPDFVERIAFLDSNYGYDDINYGPKITRWLKSDNKKYLCTLAYNDSVVVYNGKPLVSPTGGTWYRSKMMRNFLWQSFRFNEHKKDTIIWEIAQKKRVEIILRTNPDKLIYHTRQVEYNGFIQSILSGTKYEGKGYRYFGERVYKSFIGDSVIIPIRRFNIPARDPYAEPGSDFMKRISSLGREEREVEIFKAISKGNIPDFLRNTVTLKGEFPDSAGVVHKVIYEVMPDYLAVGSDSDFCRIPMNPHTAQKLATLFGGSMITSKLSNNIYENAPVKLTPFSYLPVGNANELAAKFQEHNAQIEKQFSEAGGKRGQLVAGIKKDVILSERVEKLPGKVIIYGWHKSDGKPIQPVYGGHVDWYVDYSHGIRLINNQIILDGKPVLFSDILCDPVLFRLFSDEVNPMVQPWYSEQ